MYLSSVERVVGGAKLFFEQTGIVAFCICRFLFVVIANNLKKWNTYLCYPIFVSGPHFRSIPNGITQRTSVKPVFVSRSKKCLNVGYRLDVELSNIFRFPDLR